MNLKEYVIHNQELMQKIKDRTPGDTKEDMLYGTLDFAVARFNTILLKLSQDEIKRFDHRWEVKECFDAIQKFFTYTKKYSAGNFIQKFYYGTILHGIGTKQIPKIKKLHKILDN
tara:strand:- start:2724 stop:3068 length:345 start_codon:yes stop_codon:yes gene_type:complete